jgi:CitMHS family citrate-Mg2+:H+ or citrate-Ca2+:H+ symporter
MIPALVVGLVMVLLFAAQLGLSERRRIGSLVLPCESLLVAAAA